MEPKHSVIKGLLCTSIPSLFQMGSVKVPPKEMLFQCLDQYLNWYTYLRKYPNKYLKKKTIKLIQKGNKKLKKFSILSAIK